MTDKAVPHQKELLTVNADVLFRNSGKLGFESPDVPAVGNHAFSCYAFQQPAVSVIVFYLKDKRVVYY